MDIDLQHVLSYSKDSLQSRAQMRAIMKDLYPGKILEMNILLDVYESGVPREIRNTGTINDVQYTKYMQKIINDYGLQQRYVIDALNAWIDVCISPGTSSRLKLAGGQQHKPIEQPITNPINHVPINTGQVVVNGNTSDYETKSIRNDQVIITKFIGFDIADTIVPNEIDGKRVVEIGDNAYKSCSGIKSLVIPEGIVKIGASAFSNCDSLVSVTLPTTLIEIGERAFYNTGIRSLDMPNGIKTISAFTFCYCKNLMKVILPDSLRVIESAAFQRCSALTSISLPSGVIEIKRNVFEECTSLTKVDLNEGLQSIGEEAFKKCISLKSIVIPRSVTTFGDGIFSNKYSFDKLDIEVLCYQGSKAVEYARNNNLKVIKANMTS